MLYKLPKGLQPRSKAALHEMMAAPTKAVCEKLIPAFIAEHEAKYPRAAKALETESDKSASRGEDQSRPGGQVKDFARRRLFVRWLVALLAIGGALVVVAGFLLWLSISPTPNVERSSAHPSPDGQWQATLEQVDNGMGMGLGVLYYEVHVQKPGAAISRHGDSDRSVVFYVDSEERNPPRIRWVDDRHLAIDYQIGPHEAGRKLDRIADVEIAYSRYQ